MFPSSGETVIITKDGISIQQCVPPRTFAPDIFEYVYFSRPDSVLDGISVYRSRMAMGDALAINARAVLAAAGIVVDVVIPVPDTSRVAALQVAQSLNVPYREGFVKNRYVGRTFIMPGQEIRWVCFVAVLCVDQGLMKLLQAQERSPQAQRHGARILRQDCALG